MSRLPIPGSDDGSWGGILNDYLSQSLNNDGTLKGSAVTNAGGADDLTVVHTTSDELVAGIKTFSSSPILPTPTTGTQAATKAYVDTAAASGTPDADATTKGKLRLTGDLGGTATSPTVPGLADRPIGPVTATDNAIARYEGTTGKIIQDSLVTISDSGQLLATSSSSFMLNSSAASSTVPTLIPNRSATTTGIGVQAVGNISLITSGAERVRVTDTGTQITSGTFTIGNNAASIDSGGIINAPRANLTASGAGATPLFLKGAASQTADLTQWQDSAGAAMTVVNSAGRIGVGMSTPLYPLVVQSLSAGVHITPNGTDTGMYLMGFSGGGAFISSNAAYNGSAWVAKGTSASIYSNGSGAHAWYGNTGLTAGTTYTVNQLMTLTAIGQLRMDVAGSSGGLVIASDANLYRSAANTLSTDGGLVTGGSLLVGGGAIAVGNVTSNWIDFGTVGIAGPTFTTRSVGTKIIGYKSLTGSVLDYAIGLESGAWWMTTGQFNIYNVGTGGLIYRFDVATDFYSATPIRIANRGSDPATPTAAGTIYVKAGALYFRGSSGSVTMIAPA